MQPPDIDLSDRADLDGTLRLLRSAGVLPWAALPRQASRRGLRRHESWAGQVNQ